MVGASLKIAYVPCDLSTYYAAEYEVVNRSVKDLEDLSDRVDFELRVITQPVRSADDAQPVIRELNADGVDFVLLQYASFAMGDIAKAFASSSLRLGLWATEEPTKYGPILLNNFVAMNMGASIITRFMKNLPIKFKWFFGTSDNGWLAKRLDVTVKALKATKGLADCTIGLFGGVAPTFYNFVFDERKVESQLGTRVFTHELAELIEKTREVAEGEIAAVVSDLTNFVGGRVGVSAKDMDTSARVYVALRNFADNNGYDGLAVSDWPQFQSSLEIHPGMAFSWLSHHDGIPVSAEGDVLGAMSMILLGLMSDEPALLLDMSDVDFDEQAVLMWHAGGSPLSLANRDEVSWENHSTLGRKVPDGKVMGAVANFKFRPGPVTVTRVARDAEQLFIMEADIVEGRYPGFDGSRGWVKNFVINHEPATLADLVEHGHGRGHGASLYPCSRP